MRLLLDEHYSPRIAHELRRRGHDVVAARERPELHGLADATLFALMPAERRAIVTENAADFLPLLRAASGRGTVHFGLALTSPRRFPRTSRSVGTLVRALDRFLRDHPRDDALLGQVHWLQPARPAE